MTTLQQLRTLIVDVVTGAGIPVSGSVPDRFTPPLAVLIPGSPYISDGQSYGHFDVRHDVVVIAGAGENQPTITALDRMVQDTVLAVVDCDGVMLEEVSQPALYGHKSGEYLSCVISVKVPALLGADDET